MNTEQILEAALQLPEDELSVLISQLNKHRLKTLSTKPSAPVRSGFIFSRQSSKDCSASQRTVFLGSRGSGLQRLAAPTTFGGATYDQVATTKDGAIVFSTSATLGCKASKDPVEAPEIITRVREGDFSKCSEVLPLLNRSFSSRSHERYSKIPISEGGCPLLHSPYYPIQEVAPHYLDALPFQRYLYTLKVDWYTRYQIVDNYVLVMDDYHAAFLPLSQDEA